MNQDIQAIDLNQNQDGWACYEAIRATLDLHISDHPADQGCPTDGHSILINIAVECR